MGREDDKYGNLSYERLNCLVCDLLARVSQREIGIISLLNASRGRQP